MMASEENCTVVLGNLWKAWKSWERLTRILGREGAIQVGDVDDEHPHGTVPGMVSTQGSQIYHWDATKESGGWELGMPTSEDGNT